MIKNNILVDEHYSIYHIENEVFIACFTIIAHQGGNQEHLFLSWYENKNIDLIHMYQQWRSQGGGQGAMAPPQTGKSGGQTIIWPPPFELYEIFFSNIHNTLLDYKGGKLSRNDIF